MDTAQTRALVSQLQEDLSWLEEHCRKQESQAHHSGQLRLAAALVRNAIGPYLDGQPAHPLHVAVVGGAGTGKSTVVNLLTGSNEAEANPQAGFTRHPIAYTSVNGAVGWPAHLNFLGPLQRLTEPTPSNLDQDVYQVRKVSAESLSSTLLQSFVVWDCPDMTTWAAAGYIPRLMEVCGLTDVLVYVASDERYNDEVPTQFLRLLLQAGKPVVVVLTKMREADAQAFLDHFKQAVLSQLPGGAINCLAIPFLANQDLTSPTSPAARYRIPLLNQVMVLGEPAKQARMRSVRLAMNYLISHCDHLLGVARDDLTALRGWQTTVEAGKMEFERRYRNEYLETEKFRRFDEALVRLLELLELPGAAGQVVSKALYVMRTPYRLIKGWFMKAMGRAETGKQPELPVLEAAMTGWLDSLRKEAVRNAQNHPVWQHIERGFATGGLSEQAKEQFQTHFRTFQLGLAEEVERTARSIYEELEKNPSMLTALRGGKLALDIAAMSGAIISGGIGVTDFILVPLAASVSHQLVEWLGAQYVENQREQTRHRQEELLKTNISGPMSEWLAQWPSSGGSAYERLQLALTRIPSSIMQIDGQVTEALKKAQ